MTSETITSTADIISSFVTVFKRSSMRAVHGRIYTTNFTNKDGATLYLSVKVWPDVYPDDADILNFHMEEIRILDRAPEDFSFEMERVNVRETRKLIIAFFGQDTFDKLYANGEKFHLA